MVSRDSVEAGVEGAREQEKERGWRLSEAGTSWRPLTAGQLDLPGCLDAELKTDLGGCRGEAGRPDNSIIQVSEGGGLNQDGSGKKRID